MGAAFSLIANVALPVGGGFAIGLLTKDEIPSWYAKLQKPSWTPPNKVFPIAWSVFYAAMGVAAYVTTRAGGAKGGAMTLYGLQLALNFAWTPLFFKAHVLDASLLDITALLGVAAAATVKMAKTSKRPEIIWPLMGPYLGWLAFATALNAELLRENSTETLLDWKKVSSDIDEKTAPARAAAKGAADKAAAATKEAAERAAAAAKDTAERAAAATKDAAERAAAAASAVADEVKAKAAEDVKAFKQTVFE
ncbi:translocator [Raphidocelis subcapitata]|uniref:Translocator n=1 Tax=Raphidocelis subcapitata TaxID=307507 RepID=A0A2V0PS07_9CHLO|nr:translocator [Raphidocelis subcapitata]|eukprot:GBG00368.1 translocator [Raphidocelis subcapitata]